MSNKRLFFWVEGDDDKRFFEKIIMPIFEKRYDLINVRTYSKMKKQKVINFLKVMKSLGWEYIFTGDINFQPCATAKKRQLKGVFSNLDKDRMIIVEKEIESWYLAGLNYENCKKFHIKFLGVTDNVNKEKFCSIMPKMYNSKIDFMFEILKCFSIRSALENNSSFMYFAKKFSFVDLG